MMDKELHATVDSCLQQEKVTGVLCSDLSGFSIAARGDMNSSQAGCIASLAARAALLEKGQETAPVITVESDNFSILIRRHNNVTMAIKKKL
eukprot:m.18121 g.18121  ORF g.18121 m.18121 type:complete len:92 (+) comp6201_c0_seq1:129-404(+)